MIKDIINNETTKEHDLYKEIDKVCKAYWKNRTETEDMCATYIIAAMIMTMDNFVHHPDHIIGAVRKIHTDLFADYE